MGGNASSGLGSADHHGIRDMKSMGADDRPTERDEETNRKSLFPGPKTLNINTHCHAAAADNDSDDDDDDDEADDRSGCHTAQSSRYPSTLITSTRG